MICLYITCTNYILYISLYSTYMLRYPSICTPKQVSINPNQRSTGGGRGAFCWGPCFGGVAIAGSFLPERGGEGMVGFAEEGWNLEHDFFPAKKMVVMVMMMMMMMMMRIERDSWEIWRWIWKWSFKWMDGWLQKSSVMGLEFSPVLLWIVDLLKWSWLELVCLFWLHFFWKKTVFSEEGGDFWCEAHVTFLQACESQIWNGIPPKWSKWTSVLFDIK